MSSRFCENCGRNLYNINRKDLLIVKDVVFCDDECAEEFMDDIEAEIREWRGK